MKSIKNSGWINLYKDKDELRGCLIYDTQEKAKEEKIITQNYITTVKIEWES